MLHIDNHIRLGWNPLLKCVEELRSLFWVVWVDPGPWWTCKFDRSFIGRYCNFRNPIHRKVVQNPYHNFYLYNQITWYKFTQFLISLVKMLLLQAESNLDYPLPKTWEKLSKRFWPPIWPLHHRWQYESWRLGIVKAELRKNNTIKVLAAEACNLAKRQAISINWRKVEWKLTYRHPHLHVWYLSTFLG